MRIHKVIFTIILFITIAASCKKSSSPDYTSKMGGVRIWHGSTSSNFGTGNLIDTFEILVINGRTIAIPDSINSLYINNVSFDTVYYLSSNSSSHTYTFYGTFPSNYALMGNIYVAYNYVNNSITYASFIPTSFGGTNDTLITP